MTSPDFGVQAFLWWKPEVADRDLQLIQEAGFKWVKQLVSWQDVEGAGKGQYDWTNLDRIVGQAEQHGLNSSCASARILTGHSGQATRRKTRATSLTSWRPWQAATRAASRPTRCGMSRTWPASGAAGGLTRPVTPAAQDRLQRHQGR